MASHTAPVSPLNSPSIKNPLSMASPPPTTPIPNSAPHQPTKFRFKSSTKHPHPPDHSEPPSKRRRHRHHHHRSHTHSPQPPIDDPTLYDSTYLPNASSAAYPHPDTAFRESLFDALADDEGAAFWEGVYGQPIHTYSPYHASATSDKPPTAEDRMTDDEYTAYVRSKMWEKSHGYIVEERKRREDDRARRRRKEAEGRRWEQGVEEALKRGVERREKNKWKGIWEGYLRGWDEFGKEGKAIKELKIPWPVESGKREDVGNEAVERFFKFAVPTGSEEWGLGKVLKGERVRWHPDKVQQRARARQGRDLDEGTLKCITGVFQVVDRLWEEMRGS